MKKINEYELLDRVNGLREKIVESEQQAQEDVMGTLAKYAAPVGNAIKGAAGKAWNGIKAAGSAMANNPGKTALGVAGTTALAANALTPGATKPGAPAGAPAGTTAPKGGGKSDPAVLKQQQDLIAKGAKIKADGIMGPATQAAIKQFGGAPAAPEAPAAAPAAPDVPAANPMAQDPAQQQQQAAAPQTSMDDSDDVNAREFVPPTASAPAPMKGGYGSGANNPSLATPAAAPAPAPMKGGYGSGTQMAQLAQTAQQGLQTGQPASTDALMKQAQTALAAKTAAPAGKPGETAQAQAAATAPAGAAVQGQMAAESVGFRNDELNRILTLIHHR